MTPRLPQTSDFPGLTTYTRPPPTLQPHLSSVLVLLHGLGDTQAPYITLGNQLSLPETVVLCVQAPTPLPFDIGGFHWGDDVIFDAGGGLDSDAGFKQAQRVMVKVLKGLQTAGWSQREILIWGVGQGGMAGLAAGLMTAEEAEWASDPKNTETSKEGTPIQSKLLELGGIISLGGPIPSGITVKIKSRTPVLICGGSSQTLVPDEKINRINSCYEFVEKARWRRGGDGMPRSRDEMMPIMQFLARRLRSKAGVPEGSVEIS